MAYVRGQERFLYEQFVQHVRTGLLTHLNWDGTGLAPGRLPWGASSGLKIVEESPGDKVDAVAPNTIAITEGRIPDEEGLEMGGGLVQVLHTFFVDIYGENASIARSIGGDVRSLLMGKVSGVPRAFPLRNYAANGAPPLDGHLLRLEDVEMNFPDTVGKTTWVVVKVTVVHEYIG